MSGLWICGEEEEAAARAPKCFGGAGCMEMGGGRRRWVSFGLVVLGPGAVQGAGACTWGDGAV